MLKEQEKIIKDVIEEWVNCLNDRIGKEIDKEAFEEGMEDLYEFHSYEKPIFDYYDSPKALIMAENPHQSPITLYGRQWKSTSEYRDEAAWRKYYLFRGRDLTVLLQNLPRILKTSTNSIYGNYYYAAWMDLLHRMGSLEFEDFDKYKNFSKSGFFIAYTYEKYVTSIHPPIEINIENSLLHSLKDSSLKFRDGDEYYFIRGVEIERDIFKKTQNRSITLEEVLKIKNEEEKSAILLMYQELYGEEGMYQFISKRLKEVDSYYHKTGDKTLCYTLLNGKLGDRNFVAYVRCYCPSTDRMFFLGVPAWNTNAKEGIASLYRIPKRLKNHIKYINRQGERFTTVLTDKGNEIRKNMTKEELSDLTTISGDDYFRLMRYEY